MGSPKDFAAMLAFCKTKRILPVVDKIFPFEKVEEAFRWMEEGRQFGKIVVDLTVA